MSKRPTIDWQTPMPADQRRPIQSPNPPHHHPSPIAKKSASSTLIPLHLPAKKEANIKNQSISA
jgi:hypothetical protein